MKASAQKYGWQFRAVIKHKDGKKELLGKGKCLGRQRKSQTAPILFDTAADAIVFSQREINRRIKTGQWGHAL